MQSVIVLDHDPQVLKGLVLLLEDLQFRVMPMRHPEDLDTIKAAQTDCPALLLLPFEIAKGQSGVELVTRLRTLFQHHIPAILLSHENGFFPDRFVGEDIVVLTDRITPKELRRHISTRLTNTLAV